EGLTRLRSEVLQAASTRLEQLHQPVATAASANDEAALAAAIETMAQGLEPASRWPNAVAEPLVTAVTRLAAARTTLEQLRSTRITSVWQSFDELLGKPPGDAASWQACLSRLDFAGAATGLEAFATG